MKSLKVSIMDRNFFIVFIVNFLFIAHSLASQDTDSVEGRNFGCSAGLGVTLVRASDIVDYVNSISSSATRVDDFGVAAEFFGTVELRLNPTVGLKLEYAYLLKSHTVSGSGYPDYIVSYGVHMPTLIVQYLFFGKGYGLKLGGGFGYHIAAITQDYSSLGNIEYTSHGIGIKAEAEANTEFDEHLYGVITGDIRDDIMSEIKDSVGKPLIIRNTGKHAGMNFFSLGVKFGMIYYF